MAAGIEYHVILVSASWPLSAARGNIDAPDPVDGASPYTYSRGRLTLLGQRVSVSRVRIYR